MVAPNGVTAPQVIEAKANINSLAALNRSHRTGVWRKRGDGTSMRVESYAIDTTATQLCLLHLGRHNQCGTATAATEANCYQVTETGKRAVLDVVFVHTFKVCLNIRMPIRAPSHPHDRERALHVQQRCAQFARTKLLEQVRHRPTPQMKPQKERWIASPPTFRVQRCKHAI
jgi:hypothetical protein